MPEALQSQFARQAGDLLTELEPYLLELEVAGEDAESELLGRIFRVIHGIRCGAGLTGMLHLRDLARRLEVVLGMVREQQMPVTQAVVRMLLRGCAAVQELLAGAIPDSYAELMEALSGTARSNMSDAESLDQLYPVQLPDGTPILHISGYELERCLSAQSFLYVLEFDLQRDVLGKEITPLSLLDYLQKSGHVLATHCDGEADSPEGSCLENGSTLYVLFSSILEPDLVDAVFMLDPGQIHQIEPTDVVSGAASWTDAIPETPAEAAPTVVAEEAPVEGLDDLIAEFDRAMEDMRLTAKVPFVPWSEDDGNVFEVQAAHEEVPDAFDMLLASQTTEFDSAETPVSMSEGPPSVSDGVVGAGESFVGPKLPFDRLAPVDDLLDADDEDASLEAGVTSDEALSVPADPHSAEEEDVTALWDAEHEAHLLPDGGPGMNTSSALTVEYSQESAEPEAAAEPEAGMVTADTHAAPQEDAVDDELAALEREFEQALLDEARATGLIPQDDGPSEKIGSDDAVFSLTEIADEGADGQVDPDADLFEDSGTVPDMSYLDVPRTADDDGGVVFNMQDEVRTVHGFSVAVDGDDAVLALDGELTIAHASRIREVLLDLLTEFNAVRLNMEAAEAVDVTFVQILFAVAKTAGERGGSLQVVTPVPEIAAQVFSRCGLDATACAEKGFSGLFAS